VTVEDRAVNVIELGEGPPVVFVHGLSGSWQNWLEQLPVLATEHRVVALDLPGFGHSPLPLHPISIADYARLLDVLLGELRIDAAALVGNSMGGFVAAELAISAPQRVERLVLVSAAGISTHNDPRTGRVLPSLHRAERIAAMTAGWVAAHSDQVTSRARLRQGLMWMIVRHPTRIAAALAAEQVRGTGKPGFMPALQAIYDYDIRERLPQIACPTWVVWGENDQLVGVKDAHVFAELIPDSRLTIFADTGHMAMLERPAAFNAQLRDFLSES
jgi:pimeloyl-ACP methyl ester carboxylesterase